MTSGQERPGQSSDEDAGRSQDTGEDVRRVAQEEVAQAIQPVIAELRHVAEEVGAQNAEVSPSVEDSGTQLDETQAELSTTTSRRRRRGQKNKRAPQPAGNSVTTRTPDQQMERSRSKAASGTRAAVDQRQPASPLESVLGNVVQPVLGSVADTVDAVQETVGIEVLPSRARRQQLEERVRRLEALLGEESQDGEQEDVDLLEDRLSYLEDTLGSRAQEE